METRKAYMNLVEIDGESLKSHEQWRPPSNEEIATALELAGWGAEVAVKRLGVSNVLFAAWLSGERQITYSAWCVICAEASLGNIW